MAQVLDSTTPDEPKSNASMLDYLTGAGLDEAAQKKLNKALETLGYGKEKEDVKLKYLDDNSKKRILNTLNAIDKKEKRHDRLEKAARIASKGAEALGLDPLAAGLDKFAGEIDPKTGLPRRGTTNRLGERVQNYAAKNLGATTGQSSLVGGAVAGALQGQGVKGIAYSAANWYVLDIAFGALFTLVGSIPALLYLDFHWVMSKLGSKIFQPMRLWQQITLAIANLLVIAIIALFFGVIYGVCNYEGATGTVIRWMVGIREECKYFTVDFGGGRSGGAGGGASFAQLDIVVTSAYRPGSRTNEGKLSAHGRGEAIDIALRNPTVPIRGSDSRIAQLVAIAKAAGFAPLPGDTLDEYANPTCDGEPTCGGHVHVEFNMRPDGKTTYCDDTVVKDPPVDLVPIPASIPVQGASDPRVRPCMFDPVKVIFDAAQAISED